MPMLTSTRPTEGAQRIELESGWEFLPDRSGRMQYADLAEAKGWRAARAGISWNVQFEDLREYMGAAWYRIALDVPVFSDLRHILLKFGAVDYFCEVFVNGQSVGIHEGGYTPFTMEVTNAVRLGLNEICVRVVDPPMDEAENRQLFPQWMYHEIPHGKQNWYVQNSGIWQGVRIEFCPSIYVDRLDITPDISGAFTAVVRVAGIGLVAHSAAAIYETDVTLNIYDASGRRVFSEHRELGAEHELTITGSIPDRRLWGPDDPHLYVAEITLSGPVSYKRRTRFGIREFAARDGKFYLNGEPFYMVAALDQDFYPETIHTPSSEEIVRDMMLKARRLGVNTLRCHLKVAHPVYLDMADELGMLVWTEMPSWSDCWFPCDHFSTIAAVRGEKMFAEIMARDWNHPCICIHTIMNESWGINLKDAAQRDWLKDTFNRVKAALAPSGRLVVDNSACEGNFHVKTDIEDFHNYYSMPDQVELWEKFVKGLASRPDWTFSPYGDAERTGKEPIVLSEFGNWGLPQLPRELPWWFHTNFGDREATRPSGVHERFEKFGFNAVFRGYEELSEETQWHQYISLKHEIESIRCHGSIQGYVITGMTDVHWEVNGLLDMWRNPKVFNTELSALQRPDLVLARTEKHTAFAGSELKARLFVSHYSKTDLSGARVKWWTESGASGQLAITSPLFTGSVQELGEITFPAANVAAAEVERLRLELRTKQGRLVSENHLDYFVLPERTALGMRLIIHDPPGQITSVVNALRQRPGDHAADASSGTLMLSSVFDREVERHLADGGRALILVNDDKALRGLDIEVKTREANEYDGRWFSNFNWIRADRAPFQEVSFGRILGFESRAVVPRFVLKNVAAESFDDVLAGATYGWINLNVALALQARVKKGTALFTVFRFDEIESDAYAASLFRALLRYAVSPECNPRLSLSWTVPGEVMRA